MINLIRNKFASSSSILLTSNVILHSKDFFSLRTANICIHTQLAFNCFSEILEMLYEFLDILFVNLISLNLVTADGANHSVVLFLQLFYPDERLKEKGKSVSWVYKCHTSFELSWYLWIKIFHLHYYAVCNMHVNIFIC